MRGRALKSFTFTGIYLFMDLLRLQLDRYAAPGPRPLVREVSSSLECRRPCVPDFQRDTWRSGTARAARRRGPDGNVKRRKTQVSFGVRTQSSAISVM